MLAGAALARGAESLGGLHGELAAVVDTLEVIDVGAGEPLVHEEASLGGGGVDEVLLVADAADQVGEDCSAAALVLRGAAGLSVVDGDELASSEGAESATSDGSLHLAGDGCGEQLVLGEGEVLHHGLAGVDAAGGLVGG